MLNSLLKPILTRLPENNQLERIWILAKTDFIERYYGTKLGVFWALLNPFFQLVVYYVVFTLLFSVEIPNFALYLFSGLILMMFFSESTTKGLGLLSKHKSILQNIIIRKTDLYYAAIISNLMGFTFNLLTYLVFSIFFNVEYTWYVLYVPIIIINVSIFILAIQLILGIIHVYFRDINHLWDMMLLVLFWGSPVFYSKEVILNKLPALLYVNPLAGILVNLRETLLYGNPPDFQLLILNFIVAIVLYLLALLIFKKFADKAIEIL